jgi:ATP-binding cassette subfamily B protein
VPQSPFILNDTIYENLTFKQPVDKDFVIKACIQANFYEVVESLPNGFDTRLGEQGVGLSLGQLQRLSIARALIKESPILLLDEITSSLDQSSANAIFDTIASLKDKTIIMVSHQDIQHINPDLIIDISKTSAI